MFSVNNFYDFMSWNYGYPRRDIRMYKHLHDGSKDIKDLQVWKLPPPPPEYHRTPIGILGGSLVLHDQEPFMRSYVDIYREHRIEKNNWRKSWLELPDHILFLESISTCSWPIFCHSEQNSTDIKWLEEHGVIGCHYLWHGLISRDWFRYWKHHPGLKGKKSNWSYKFLLYANGKTGTRTYRKNLISALHDIKDQVQYDWDETKSIPSTHSATIDVDDAHSSAIHIVAETVFDHDKIHATEKIFKPMVMGQPFIVFAGAGMLGYLRQYGFKTFDSIWDESYDMEPDHEARFNKLINLIKSLNDLPEAEFRRKMERCQEIADYNQKHFYSEQFETVMLAELRDNMQTALTIQKERSLSDPGGSFFYVFDYLLSNGIEPFPAMQQWVDHLKTKKHNSLVAKISSQYPWFAN